MFALAISAAFTVSAVSQSAAYLLNFLTVLSLQLLKPVLDVLVVDVQHRHLPLPLLESALGPLSRGALLIQLGCRPHTGTRTARQAVSHITGLHTAVSTLTRRTVRYLDRLSDDCPRLPRSDCRPLPVRLSDGPPLPCPAARLTLDQLDVGLLLVGRSPLPKLPQ